MKDFFKYTDKKLIKTLLIIGCGMALFIAWFGPYESISQGSTSPYWDWALRSYLNPLMIVFTLLGVLAIDRKEKLKGKWLNLSFRDICFFTAIMVWGVDATNVVDYSLPNPEDTSSTKSLMHMIFTGLTIGGASFLAWNFYKAKTWARYWSMLAVIIGVAGFGIGFLTGLWTISWGEFIATAAVSAVVWPIINEQVQS